MQCFSHFSEHFYGLPVAVFWFISCHHEAKSLSELNTSDELQGLCSVDANIITQSPSYVKCGRRDRFVGVELQFERDEETEWHSNCKYEDDNDRHSRVELVGTRITLNVVVVCQHCDTIELPAIKERKECVAHSRIDLHMSTTYLLG